MGPKKQCECEKLLAQMVQRTALVTQTKKQRDALVAILVNLNSLSIKIGVQAKPAKGTRQIAEQLVIQLGDLLQDSQGRLVYGTYVSEMMADLNDLAAIKGMWTSPKEYPLDMVGKRLAEAGMSYRLKKDGANLNLIENCEGRFNLEITKVEYADAASVLSKAVGKPTKYQLLNDQFMDRGDKGSRSRNLLRIVLRFWQLSDPPLIKKERAKYSPVAETAKEFRRQAKRAWDNLPVQQ